MADLDRYPDRLLRQVQAIAPHLNGQYAAQLLWQRGWTDPEAIATFLNPEQYQPTPPSAFGEEMVWAINRLQQARTQGEKVTIWGDFDADGVTATSVLWEGLGQFLEADQLDYTIPNRLTESHGLNAAGIERLHRQGTGLIVTCDTGCTNLAEIAYAQELGIDIILTDHHTLPPERPPVVACINPRQLPKEHPLATLSGVAVAYKLVEAWYQQEPQIPTRPLENLLDLVAIGLIADLVELRGDCRYLAQMGLRILQTRLQDESIRPGVTELLKLCKKSGDRPTDISFGIGPRINAVSRIRGEASFCVELLTSQDAPRCRSLAQETELANSRRKALQQRIKKEAIEEVEKLDLSTTQVIVVAKRQWPVGVLGLVAGEIAQQYDRPTFLLTLDESLPEPMAKGSARSVQGIDLYELMQHQSHVLTKFGGHPFAAGLSLPVSYLDLFRQGLNQSLRSRQALQPKPEAIAHDLIVTVQDLGKSLFKELQLLEPYGMGNPVPKLLIQNCWFEEVTHRNLTDRTGKKLKYIQALFLVRDDSLSDGFPGLWWEHYKDEVPTGRCHVIGELDFNNFKHRYEFRVTSVHALEASSSLVSPAMESNDPEILDFRNQAVDQSVLPDNALVMRQCPHSWDELGRWVQRSRQTGQPLVLAYDRSDLPNGLETWRQLVGIAKEAQKNHEFITEESVAKHLGLPILLLNTGISLLRDFGFKIKPAGKSLVVEIYSDKQITNEELKSKTVSFIKKIDEIRFLQLYFFEVSIGLIQQDS